MTFRIRRVSAGEGARRSTGIWWSGAALGGALFLLAWIRFGPLPEGLIDPARHQSLTVVDRNGEVLYEPLASTGNRASWLAAAELPPHVIHATISAEDQRFFRHPGVDPIAISRAMLHNVRNARVVEGGSTITQQVAKLLLGSQRRTLAQKARETVIALRLEHRLTKREILALYLNLAPYGNRISGIARASRSYFGVAPGELTPAQAAYLAALPQRPSAFNPLRDSRRAISRQQYVLARMHEDGLLDAAALQHARAERLRFDSGAKAVVAQHFIERVLASNSDATLIRTTLDANLQRQVAGIIAANRNLLLEHGAKSVAVAVLDNATGEWLAWEGSGDYFGQNFGGAIDGVTALRQPGSTLKPFTYALAFERGMSPATVVPDIPSHFATAEEGVVYTPRNYDGRYRGPLRIRAALAGSENVPAVAMLNKLGPPSLLRFLHAAGFRNLDKTADYYGLGLTLGDAEVSLEQLIAAYATLARGGVHIPPRFTTQPRNPAPAKPLLAKRTAFLITDILSDPEAREFIFGSGGSLDFPFPVAVKTGTSQAYRDNWVLGYTREVTVGVWVGNFDRAELRNSTGITGAGPIFNGVMLAAVKRARGAIPVGDQTPILDPPADVEHAPICTLSGARPNSYCPTVQNEWTPTTSTITFCTWHRDGYVDWPAEYRAWAGAAPRASVQQASLRVINPANGATYLIDPTLRTEFQQLSLRAATASKVTWRVNDRPLDGHEWPLTPGRHTITAIDGDGRRDSVTIFVK